MPLVVNSNIASLNAQRQLLQSGMDLDSASERLASGRRINSAADDAAGLAISNRQTSQIRGLDQAVRNANDGISLIQTAEGALDETTNILQRMRELAIQSANGIYSDTDRATLDAEVQQLKAEIDRIAETTAFNGQNILDGSLGSIALQVGSDSNQTIDFSVQGFSSSSLGGSGGDIIGEATAGGVATLDLFDAADAAHTLSVNDVDISDLSTGTTLQDALDIFATDLEGKGVEVSTLVSLEATNVGDGILNSGESIDITVVDANAETSTYVITDTSSLDELVSSINASTPLTASVNESGKLVIAGENLTSITVADDSGSDGASGILAASNSANFSLVFTSTNGDAVKVETGAVNDTDVQALGVDVQDDDGNLQGSTVTTAATGTTINAGDLIINGVEIGQIDSGASAILTTDAAITAINKLSAETGVVAYEVAGDTDKIGLTSTTGSEISIEYGDNATATDIIGVTGLQERNAASGAGSIAGVSVDSVSGAQAAIDVIDTALEQINTTRSDLGAVNNRLDFTVSNLTNVSENTAAARSRTVDADFAAETANLSRAQVLQQASQAILAQANARPQQVLSLLQ